jgi:hypothetical protein
MIKIQYHPCAKLFCNGSAYFTDGSGEPILHLQPLGWKGIHSYVQKYPLAHIRMEGTEKPLSNHAICELLENIAQPTEAEIIIEKCPFCLNYDQEEFDVISYDDDDFFHVFCLICMCSGPAALEKSGAIEKWNSHQII